MQRHSPRKSSCITESAARQRHAKGTPAANLNALSEPKRKLIHSELRRRVSITAPKLCLKSPFLKKKKKTLRVLLLTHYRPAMLFGNRKLYFRESLEFSIVII